VQVSINEFGVIQETGPVPEGSVAVPDVVDIGTKVVTVVLEKAGLVTEMAL